MNLIDTHCHLDDSSFDPDREQVLAHCRALGITKLVVPAVDAASWAPLLQLCAEHEELYPALGMHPIYVDRHTDEHLIRLAKMVREHQPVAVGEIGLDYFIEGADRVRQLVLLEAQLDIAVENRLPVLLHCRKAHDQMLSLLRKKKCCGGIAHAFGGSEQQAYQYIDLGFKLGFGGMLTYERSSKLRRLARSLPLEAIVLETDAPDMTVASHHGERNSPEYLPECLRALAELRNRSIEEVAVQTTANAMGLLKLN